MTDVLTNVSTFCHNLHMTTKAAESNRPYKVARDGTVTHREGGHVIGWVYLTHTGWVAYDLTRTQLPRDFPNGRKYAARAVWQAYASRHASPAKKAGA